MELEKEQELFEKKKKVICRKWKTGGSENPGEKRNGKKSTQPSKTSRNLCD